MRPEQTIGLDRATADALRQVARELAAQQKRRVTLAEAVRTAITAWRQLTADHGPGTR